MVGDIIGIVGSILLIVISIYVLAVFGNAIAHSGGTQALGIIYQGISTLVFIVFILGILGVGHFIVLVQRVIGFFR